jgi:RNA polymerase sigma-70 factor (ECF subfamily)
MRSDRRQWFEAEMLALLPQLLATARRLCRDRTDAEDLVAETVARAWTRLDTLSEDAALRGWCFRILMNCYATDCRTRRARPETESLEEVAEGADTFSVFERLHQPFLLWWSNPEQQFLNKLLREDLERAVDALPEAFRMAVLLADLQGMSYLEIAEVLDIPIGTVRSRLARGRSLLQKALWHHAADAGIVAPDHQPPAQPPGAS